MMTRGTSSSEEKVSYIVAVSKGRLWEGTGVVVGLSFESAAGAAAKEV
jgi:hypothetical protein